MSEKGKNIDDLIKAGFEQQDASFDGSGFDMISSQLSKTNKLDEAVKLSFNNQEAALTNLNWEEMHDRLDLETVWRNLNGYLNNRSKMGIVNLLALMLIIIAVWTPFSLVDQHFTPGKSLAEELVMPAEEESNEIVEVVISEESIVDQEIVSERELNTENVEISNINESNSTEQTSFITSNIQIENNNVHQTSSTEIIDNTILLSRIPASTVNPLSVNFNNVPVWPDIKIIKPNSDPPKSSFRIGLIGSVDNTWIFNEDTKDGFRKNSLVINAPGFTTNYGVNFQWTGKKGLVLKSNVFFKSSLVQMNEKYFHGDQVAITTETDSYRFSLLAGYSKSFGKRKMQYINANGGFYTSYLKNAIVKQDNYITQTEASFNNFNSGLELELIHGFRFGKWDLGYGVISDFSFTDIVRTEANPNKSFNVGLMATFGYNF